MNPLFLKVTSRLSTGLANPLMSMSLSTHLVPSLLKAVNAMKNMLSLNRFRKQTFPTTCALWARTSK